LDSKKRICLPLYIREMLGVKEGDLLKIMAENGVIIVKKFVPPKIR